MPDLNRRHFGFALSSNKECTHTVGIVCKHVDIFAASHYADVKGVAVLTGKFSRETLEQEDPWIILKDLSDVEHVVDIILNAPA